MCLTCLWGLRRLEVWKAFYVVFAQAILRASETVTIANIKVQLKPHFDKERNVSFVQVARLDLPPFMPHKTLATPPNTVCLNSFWNNNFSACFRVDATERATMSLCGWMFMEKVSALRVYVLVATSTQGHESGGDDRSVRRLGQTGSRHFSCSVLSHGSKSEGRCAKFGE